MPTYDPFRIAAAHLEIWNNNNLNPMKELLTPQATFRLVFEKEERPAVKAIEASMQLYRSAFPDLRLTHTNIIPTDSTLLIEWVCNGTHLGKFLEIPPTGKIGHLRGATLFKLNEDGKIVKGTLYFDQSTLLRGLGTLPKPLDEPKVREIITNSIGALNKHDINLHMTGLTPDVVAVLVGGKILQAPDYARHLTSLFVAFPDLKVEVKELAIRANEVVLTCKVTGTHMAPMPSMQIPAKNRKVDWETCVVATLAGDRINRIHYYDDVFTMLRELNAIPEPVLVR